MVLFYALMRRFFYQLIGSNQQYPVPDSNRFLFQYPDLTTERLLLRKIRRTDRHAIFDYCSRPITSQYMMWATHQELADTDRFIDTMLDEYVKGLPSSWGICLTGEERIIGSIGFSNYEPKHQRIEIGYVVSPDYWGQGLMSEALLAVTDYAFGHLPLHRIQLFCSVENVGSAKVMEKVGYRYEATHREFMFYKNKFWDVKHYALLKAEWEARGLKAMN